jgi:hypothetical protein
MGVFADTIADARRHVVAVEPVTQGLGEARCGLIPLRGEQVLTGGGELLESELAAPSLLDPSPAAGNLVVAPAQPPSSPHGTWNGQPHLDATVRQATPSWPLSDALPPTRQGVPGAGVGPVPSEPVSESAVRGAPFGRPDSPDAFRRDARRNDSAERSWNAEATSVPSTPLSSPLPLTTGVAQPGPRIARHAEPGGPLAALEPWAPDLGAPSRASSPEAVFAATYSRPSHKATPSSPHGDPNFTSSPASTTSQSAEVARPHIPVDRSRVDPAEGASDPHLASANANWLALAANPARSPEFASPVERRSVAEGRGAFAQGEGNRAPEPELSVTIGQIDVFVSSPPAPSSVAPPSGPSGYASRLYLRRL